MATTAANTAGPGVREIAAALALALAGAWAPAWSAVTGAREVPPTVNAAAAYGSAPQSYPCDLNLPGDGGLGQLYVDERAGRGYVIAPWIGLREIYTDNVNLAPSDAAESSFVTGVIPGLSACGASHRVSGQLRYRAEGYHYSYNHDRSIYHQLDAAANAELWRRRLFFNVFANNSQTVIDPRQRVSNDNALDIGANRTSQFVYGGGPTWREDLGAVGLSSLSYSYRAVNYDDPALVDTRSHTGRFTLESPPARHDFTWRAQVSMQELQRDTAPKVRNYDDASLELGAGITGHLSALVEGGAENDFSQSGHVDRFGSGYWSAGLRWQDARTLLEARAGKRFFGTSYTVRARRAGPHLRLNLSADQTPEEVSRLSINDTAAASDPASNLVTMPDGSTIGTRTLTSLSSTDVFLRRRVALNADYNIGHSVFTLGASAEERDYFNSDTTEYSEQSYLRWRWGAFVRTRIVPSWTWEHERFQGGRDDYTQRYELGVERLLTRRMQGAVRLRHQFRNSSDANQEYTENAVVLELARIF